MGSIVDDILMHYGVKRRSGRYPWGSGDTPYQRSGDFLSRVEQLRQEKITYTDPVTGKKYTGDTAIAKTLGMSSTTFRTQVALAKDERRALQVDRAKALREKGHSLNTIAEMMGYENDSSVRALLKDDVEARMNIAKNTADFLKQQLEEKGMLDVGIGIEKQLGVSEAKMEQALELLRMEGYEIYGRGVQQLTNPGKQTNMMVLCKPGTEYSEIYDDSKIGFIQDVYSPDGGDTFQKLSYPENINSSRVYIRYTEDGGSDKDGLVELRRGVEDISLGNSTYSQVRILVDKDRYMKGMAVYSDDIPKGYDVVYNTNKDKSVDKRDVFKKITNDPNNPFGSYIKPEGQRWYVDKDGKKKLSVINKRADEGDWDSWSNSLSSQFLSKQNKDLIKKQLNLSLADRKAEFEEIMSLTNPTVRKALLKSFSDDCDAAAVHLKAASLPRQKFQVILPIPKLKDTEVYAPNYHNGEKVALIRYPHGGTFEIPVLTVNNKNPNGIKLLGKTPVDAIGINKNVADRLSGADFDGDTVMVIPTGKNVKISSTPPLKGLKGFDTKLAYGYDSVKKDKDGKEHYYRGSKEIRVMKATQKEMGVISNLITDMTLLGATESELARAVRHSMVVIDAEKHKLDYKQSEKDNNISALKKTYQGHYDENGRYKEGASTLISRASSDVQIPKRQGSPRIDPATGKLTYKNSNESYIDPKTGKEKLRTQRSTKMAETDDAFSLISKARTPAEKAYATYANDMKALANEARKTLISSGKIAYDRQAKKTYEKEVNSLDSKLTIALSNAPKERQAQVIANANVKKRIKELEDSGSKVEVKKIKQQELTTARDKIGAYKERITLTDREWAAIQAGAISESKLNKIINNMDMDELRNKATPKTRTTLSEGKISKMRAMNSSGYTTAEIAKALGVSTSTVSNHLKKGD